jgi:hypothetical protein
MEERHAAPTCTGTRLLIHELVTGATTGIEGFVKVGNPVADVMNAGTPFGQEPGDGTVGGAGLQKLDLGVAEVQRDDHRPIGHFGAAGGQTKDLGIKGKGCGDVLHRDADMGDPGTGNQGSLRGGYHRFASGLRSGRKYAGLERIITNVEQQRHACNRRLFPH